MPITNHKLAEQIAECLNDFDWDTFVSTTQGVTTIALLDNDGEIIGRLTVEANNENR